MELIPAQMQCFLQCIKQLWIAGKENATDEDHHACRDIFAGCQTCVAINQGATDTRYAHEEEHHPDCTQQGENGIDGELGLTHGFRGVSDGIKGNIAKTQGMGGFIHHLMQGNEGTSEADRCQDFYPADRFTVAGALGGGEQGEHATTEPEHKGQSQYQADAAGFQAVGDLNQDLNGVH